MMSLKKQSVGPTSKGMKQEKANKYSVDELLSKSSAKAFWQNNEDKQWLTGPLIEK